MRRWVGFRCSWAFSLLLPLMMTVSACGNPSLPSVVTIDPTQAYSFDGWGTSLAWWAEAVGSWPDTTEMDHVEDALFNPSTGLGLNVVRYNLGANADTNACPRSFRAFGSIDSYQPHPPSPTSDGFDWSADEAQRTILLGAKSRGANLFEAFANSAPAWMLTNHCTQGNGGQDNLTQGNEQAYADYLATIIHHFQTNRAFGDITFNSVDPFNEPDLSWAGNQEGMHVDVSQQERVIQDLHAALGTTSATHISAPDDNNIGDTVSTYESYDPTTQGEVSQLNTHSYNGTSSDEEALYQLGQQSNKPVWMSEYTTDGTNSLGPSCGFTNKGSTTDMSGALAVSCRILLDLGILHPQTWIYWQAVENTGGAYGLLQTPFSPDDPGYQTFSTTKQYYALGQYSRFIRPGYQILTTNDPESLAAYDAASQTLVIVTTNTENQSRSVTYDLSRFGSAAGPIAVYRTSASQDLATLPTMSLSGKHFKSSAPGQSITTYVISGVARHGSSTTVLRGGVNDLTHVDWANFTYSINGQPAKVVDGVGTYEYEGTQFRLTVTLPPVYGDLTGDGEPEAAIRFQVCGANCGPSEAVVYTGTASHPIPMSTLPPGGDGSVLYNAHIITIANEVITLSGPGYSSSAPACCPDLEVRGTYRWNGSAFVTVSVQSSPLPTPSAT